MYYVNEHIKNCVRIFPPQNRHGFYRYDMNENPEGLPKDFVDAVLKEITPEYIATYPEPDRFLEKYADFLGVKKENLCATNGSDMAIRFALEVFAEKGSEVVTVAPSFEMYWVNCSMLGLQHVPVAISEEKQISVEDILDAITENTDVVVLLNPNNPVGQGYSLSDARRIAEKAREAGAVLIVDEAYHYFHKETLLPLIHEFDHVMVFRTFSKMFSMAGLRLGVVISNPQIIEYVKKSTPSFEVNTIALLFAERILEQPEILKRMIAVQDAGKAYFVQELKKHGYEFVEEAGNFVHVKPKKAPKELEQALYEKKVLIKTYGSGLLKDYVRISTGSKEAMEIFLKAFLEVEEA